MSTQIELPGQPVDIPVAPRKRSRSTRARTKHESGSKKTPRWPEISVDLQSKCVGYGLPCASCRAYYRADLLTCPICGCSERVSANGEDLDRLRLGQPRRITATQVTTEPVPRNESIGEGSNGGENRPQGQTLTHRQPSGRGL